MKKLNLLLASIGAAALLGGATFAAWAVTDNADPIGVKVTPGTIEDDDTKYVTMSWGEETKNLQNISGITLGENRKVGVVELLTNGYNYNGVLTVSIKDNTSGKAEGTASLMDYLSVHVYKGKQDLRDVETTPATSEAPAVISKELPEATLWGSIDPQYLVEDPDDREYSISDDAEGAKRAIEGEEGKFEGVFYSVFVTLDAGAMSVYGQIQNDVVFLGLDWNPQSGHAAQSKTVYASRESGWSDVYAFAWVDNKHNAEWPGVKMTNVKRDIFSLEVPADMEYIIFNDGNSGDEHQTENISFENYDPDTPYYNPNEKTWTEVPSIDDLTYKVVGKIEGSEDWTFAGGKPLSPNTSADGAEEYYAKLKFKSGDEIKVMDSDNAFYPAQGGNYVITEDGDYNVYFRPLGNEAWGYYYMYLEKITTPNYVVHGRFGADTEWTDKVMTQKEGTNEWFVESVTLAVGDEFVIHMYDKTWYNYNDVKDGVTCVEKAAASDNIVVKEAGVYDIYSDYEVSNNGHIWIALHNSAEA